MCACVNVDSSPVSLLPEVLLCTEQVLETGAEFLRIPGNVCVRLCSADNLEIRNLFWVLLVASCLTVTYLRHPVLCYLSWASVNFFCQEPDNQSFQPLGLDGLSPPLSSEAVDGPTPHRRGCVP